MPDTAIQTDQARKIVLTVDAQNQVSAKPVELGPVVDGLRIVRSGLKATDRVIIAGNQMAMPGAKVAPKAGRIGATAAATAGPAVSLPVAGEATIAN